MTPPRNKEEAVREYALAFLREYPDPILCDADDDPRDTPPEPNRAGHYVEVDDGDQTD